MQHLPDRISGRLRAAAVEVTAGLDRRVDVLVARRRSAACAD